MAITATVSLSPSTVKTEQKCTASVTISNSGSSTVYMRNVQGTVLPASGVNASYNTGVSIGVVNIGPNTNLAVPASGSLVLSFGVKFHGPVSGALDATANTFQKTFNVGAMCYGDDGSVTAATTATATVNYVVTFPTSQQ